MPYALPPFYCWCFFFLLTIACTNDAPVDNETETVEAVPVVETPPAATLETSAVDTIAVDTVAQDTTPEPQKEERPQRNPPKIKFKTTTYTYDTIQQGDIVEYDFEFTNVGERPLSIKDVKGSCGCTIGSYPFLDIAPNEENVIKARFDSKGKVGPQFTTITVYSNAETKAMVLTLKGFVKE